MILNHRTIPLELNEISSNILNKNIPITQNPFKESDYMTTVVGIKSTNGIVIASDSQFTAVDIKDLQGNKIFKINDFTALGGAGEIGQTKMLVDKLRQELGNELLSDLSLREKVEDVLLGFYKKYTVEWKDKLQLHQYINFFDPLSVLGTKLIDNIYGLYVIRFTPRPWLESIDNYETIGSGDSLAKLILRQQSRAPNFESKTFADLPYEYNIWVASLTINEIKAFETYSGGSTRLAIINKDGYRLLTNEELSNYYNNYIDGITGIFNKSGMNKEMIKAFFPKL